MRLFKPTRETSTRALQIGTAMTIAFFFLALYFAYYGYTVKSDLSRTILALIIAVIELYLTWIQAKKLWQRHSKKEQKNVS